MRTSLAQGNPTDSPTANTLKTAVMAIKHWITGVALAAFAGIGAYVYLGAGQQAAPSSTFVLLDGSQ